MTPSDDLTAGARAMELLPCPFCGGKGKLREHTDSYGNVCSHVQCTECDSKSTPCIARGTNLTEVCWNTRAGLAAMPDHSAELLEALAKIKKAAFERPLPDKPTPDQSILHFIGTFARTAIAKARAQKGGA